MVGHDDRQSATGCANERPSGSEERVARNRDPYSDHMMGINPRSQEVFAQCML